jgi:hypothetical protein
MMRGELLFSRRGDQALHGAPPIRVRLSTPGVGEPP